jgi:hypothetical protein
MSYEDCLEKNETKGSHDCTKDILGRDLVYDAGNDIAEANKRFLLVAKEAAHSSADANAIMCVNRFLQWRREGSDDDSINRLRHHQLAWRWTQAASNDAYLRMLSAVPLQSACDTIPLVGEAMATINRLTENGLKRVAEQQAEKSRADVVDAFKKDCKMILELLSIPEIYGHVVSQLSDEKKSFIQGIVETAAPTSAAQAGNGLVSRAFYRTMETRLNNALKNSTASSFELDNDFVALMTEIIETMNQLVTEEDSFMKDLFQSMTDDLNTAFDAFESIYSTASSMQASQTSSTTPQLPSLTMPPSMAPKQSAFVFRNGSLIQTAAPSGWQITLDQMGIEDFKKEIREEVENRLCIMSPFFDSIATNEDSPVFQTKHQNSDFISNPGSMIKWEDDNPARDVLRFCLAFGFTRFPIPKSSNESEYTFPRSETDLLETIDANPSEKDEIRALRENLMGNLSGDTAAKWNAYKMEDGKVCVDLDDARKQSAAVCVLTNRIIDVAKDSATKAMAKLYQLKWLYNMDTQNPDSKTYGASMDPCIGTATIDDQNDCALFSVSRGIQVQASSSQRQANSGDDAFKVNYTYGAGTYILKTENLKPDASLNNNGFVMQPTAAIPANTFAGGQPYLTEIPEDQLVNFEIQQTPRGIWGHAKDLDSYDTQAIFQMLKGASATLKQLRQLNASAQPGQNEESLSMSAGNSPFVKRARDSIGEESLDEGARKKRTVVWQSALRDVSLQGDRIYSFASTLAGLQNSPVQQLCEIDDAAFTTAAQEASERVRKTYNTIAMEHAALIRSVTETIWTNATKSFVYTREKDDDEAVIKQPNNTQGTANDQNSAVTLSQVISDLDKVGQEVMKKTLNAVFDSQMHSGANSSLVSLDIVSQPKNSLILSFAEPYRAAISTAYYRVVTQQRRNMPMSRQISVFELIEGNSCELTTQFAELVARTEVFHRLNGPGAGYISVHAAKVNAQMQKVALDKLMTILDLYLTANKTPPNFQDPGAMSTYFDSSYQTNVRVGGRIVPKAVGAYHAALMPTALPSPVVRNAPELERILGS